MSDFHGIGGGHAKDLSFRSLDVDACLIELILKHPGGQGETRAMRVTLLFGLAPVLASLVLLQNVAERLSVLAILLPGAEKLSLPLVSPGGPLETVTELIKFADLMHPTTSCYRHEGHEFFIVYDAHNPHIGPSASSVLGTLIWLPVADVALGKLDDLEMDPILTIFPNAPGLMYFVRSTVEKECAIALLKVGLYDEVLLYMVSPAGSQTLYLPLSLPESIFELDVGTLRVATIQQEEQDFVVICNPENLDLALDEPLPLGFGEHLWMPVEALYSEEGAKRHLAQNIDMLIQDADFYGLICTL